MSKKNSNPSVESASQVVVSEVPVAPPAPRRMDETDRLSLELAKANQKAAVAEAQAAVAKSETATVSHKNVILQIYVKYGLSPNDAINSETGEILVNGAVPQG